MATVNIAFNESFSVAADDLLQQHLLIIGATGAGKSTSAVAILHHLMRQNQTTVLLDPTGEYANLPNAVVAKLGFNAFVDYERLSGGDWADILDVQDKTMREKLADAVVSLKMQRHVRHADGIYEKVGLPWREFEADRQKLYNFPQSFDVTLLPAQLQQEYAVPATDATADFDLVGQMIDQQAFRAWLPVMRRLRELTLADHLQQLFNFPNRENKGVGLRTDVMYLLRLFAAQPANQKILVIDLSALSDDLDLGSTIVSLLANALLREKAIAKKTVPVVLMLDEAHRYLPDDGKADENGLSRIAREGRKFGLYLMLTTQSPLDMPAQMLGQFGGLLVHRLNTTAEIDLLPSLKPMRDVVTALNIGQAVLRGQALNFDDIINVQQVPEMQHRTESPKFF